MPEMRRTVMNKLIAIFTVAAMAVGLSGCNNDDNDERVECNSRCSCRAPLIGHAEAVPAPAPLAEAQTKKPEPPVIAQPTPAPVPAPAPVVIERAAEVSYSRPNVAQRSYPTSSSRVRTGEIQGD